MGRFMSEKTYKVYWTDISTGKKGESIEPMDYTTANTWATYLNEQDRGKIIYKVGYVDIIS